MGEPGPKTNVGVGWEMVVRWKAERASVELRAMSVEEVELRVRATWAEHGFERSLTRYIVVPIADVRQALDELERSAKEVEKL